jgi:hypothetical protein
MTAPGSTPEIIDGIRDVFQPLLHGAFIVATR